jgi:signal transduction histidine kinase
MISQWSCHGHAQYGAGLENCPKPGVPGVSEAALMNTQPLPQTPEPSFCVDRAGWLREHHDWFVAHNMDRAEQVLPQLRQTLMDWMNSRNSESIVELGLHVAHVCVVARQFDEMAAVLELLRGLIEEDASPARRAVFHAMDCWRHSHAGCSELAMEALDQLADLAIAHAAPQFQAVHADGLARVLFMHGHFERAIECSHEALRHFDNAGVHFCDSTQWMRICVASSTLNRPHDRLRAGLVAAKAARHAQHSAALCNALTGVAESHVALGDVPSAEAALQQARQALPEPGANASWLSAEIRAAEAHLLAHLGRGAEAIELMSGVVAGLEANDGRTSARQRTRRLRELAAWQLACGHTEAGVHSVDQAYRLEQQTLHAADELDMQARLDRLERQHARREQAAAQRRAIALQRQNADLVRALTLQKELQDELVSSSRLGALGTLLAGVSHELNTPLGNALTALSTIVDRCADMTQRMESAAVSRMAMRKDLDSVSTGLSLALRNVERAVVLLASYRQLDSLPSTALRRKVTLDALVQVAWEQAILPGSALRLQMSGSMELWVCAESLVAVLVELFQNAQRHAFQLAEPGVVTVSAACLDGRLRVEVADNGRGIAAELLPRIFDPYVSTQFGHGRSGLGLFNAQALVYKQLRGLLRAESEPGYGSRFVMTLPLPIARE